MLTKCVDLDYEGDHALKCIEANKHNSVTATYNLLLKKAIREKEITIKNAYECKTDIVHLLRRNPRFRKINDKVHKFFHFDKDKKSHSLQPEGFLIEKKPEVRNEYMTIYKDEPVVSKASKNEDRKRTITTAAPSLLGVQKKQNGRVGSSNRPPKGSKGKRMYVDQPPFLDNINIISPNGMPKKASTTKYCGSRRIKSNESKVSQNSTNRHENTINTNELTQFFEQRIATKDGFRKGHGRKVKNQTPKIDSNNMINHNKNITVMLDYNNSNQSFHTKQNLNNTVILDSSNYRSDSRKRDSRKTRVS